MSVSPFMGAGAMVSVRPPTTTFTPGDAPARARGVRGALKAPVPAGARRAGGWRAPVAPPAEGQTALGRVWGRVTGRVLQRQPLPSIPVMRGQLHQWGAPASVLPGVALLAVADTASEAAAVAAFFVSTTGFMAASAFRHRADKLLRREVAESTLEKLGRLDQAMIFLAIAGCYTGIAGLALPPEDSGPLLQMCWTGALLGAGAKAARVPMPRILDVTLYVLLGWAGVLALPELYATLTPREFGLLVSGGLAYTVGGVVYGIKRPDPWPTVFGHHEIFHLLTIVAVAQHYCVIESLVLRHA